jgi:hypothetical protein
MHRQFKTAAALVVVACCAGAVDPNLDVPQEVTTVWTQLQFIDVGDINAVEQSFYADFYATVRSGIRLVTGGSGQQDVPARRKRRSAARVRHAASTPVRVGV